MKTGIEAIAEERQKQVMKYGYYGKKDSGNSNKELVRAAIFMLTKSDLDFPMTWELEWRDRLKAKSEMDSLKAAGALIAAEIDRLNNKEKLCPRDCYYLSLTEEKQNSLDSNARHMCLKFTKPLLHLNAHPELYKCNECLNSF